MGTRTNQLADPRLAEALWPGAEFGRPLGSADHRYLAGPAGPDPRFLLPRERRSASAVLHHFRSPGNAAARRKLAVLRGAVATTGGWPLLHALDVRVGSADTVETCVRDALGEPVTLGIHLGPPRANRKAILQVLDEHDRARAVGKLATNELTAHLVRTEAEALSLLGGSALPGVRVPQLQHEGTLAGNPFLLMSHLPLQRAEPTVDEEHRHAAMVGIARCFETRWMLPADSGCVARLHAAALTIPERGIRDGCLRLLDLLAAVVSPWELGSWHGDWTDWNMAALDGQVVVWDWERFDADVPVGWDALHYALRRDIEHRGPVVGVSGSLLERAPDLLRPFGVPPDMASYVAAAYLVEIAIRYTADGQRRAGGRSAYVEDWILPVLDSWREGSLQ